MPCTFNLGSRYFKFRIVILFTYLPTDLLTNQPTNQPSIHPSILCIQQDAVFTEVNHNKINHNCNKFPLYLQHTFRIRQLLKEDVKCGNLVH